MERRVKIEKDGHKFYKWEDLTYDEKQKNLVLTKALFEWLEHNPNKLMSFERMNKVGLEHLYKFKVDDYNYTHQWKKVVVIKDGVFLEKNAVIKKE